MSALAPLVLAEAYNPFGGTAPSFGPFGGIIASKVGVLIGVIWAAAFVYTGYHMVTSIAGMARAKRDRRPNDLDDHLSGLYWSGGATMGLVAVPIVYATLVAL